MLKFDNFINEKTCRSHKGTASLISKSIASILKKKAYAIYYINGCCYYFKPLNDKLYGFGSGDLELKFEADMDEAAIYDQLITYFSSNYSDKIAYNGHDSGSYAKEKISKDCNWQDNLFKSLQEELDAQGAWYGHEYAYCYLYDFYIKAFDLFGEDACKKLKEAYEAVKKYDDSKSEFSYEETEELQRLDSLFIGELYKCYKEAA